MSGEGQLGVRDRGCTRGRWAWNGLPRAVGTARVPEFRERLGSALRHVAWFWGDPVWSQGLDSMVLVGSFQLRIFCECIESQNHRILRVGNLVQLPCNEQGHPQLHQCSELQGWGTTTSLGNLCQCLTAIIAKNFFLISNRNLFSLEKKRLWGHLRAACQYLRGAVRKTL